MTYVIGFSIDGVNSILSDTRVTDIKTQQGQNTALKTGILFDGCIYGVAGNVDNAFSFINAVKMFAPDASSILDAWEKLNQLIMFYDFPTYTKDDSFQILLSSRHSGQPEFYIMSSNRELFRCEEEWVSIGSGKELLDDPVEEKYRIRIEKAKQALADKNVPTATIHPYFLCLMLSELTLTFKRPRLEEKKVGGVFNFVYQTSADDNFQEPTLYIFSDIHPDTNKILLWGYRVCRVPVGLYLECNDSSLLPGIPDEVYTAIFHDPTVVDELEHIRTNPEFEQEIRKLISELPFYYFCGFGYVHPRFQYGHECHIALDHNPDTLIIKHFGDKISTDFEELIKRHYVDRQGLPGGGEGINVELLR